VRLGFLLLQAQMVANVKPLTQRFQFHISQFLAGFTRHPLMNHETEPSVAPGAFVEKRADGCDTARVPVAAAP
jgi:hypothetical protein